MPLAPVRSDSDTIAAGAIIVMRVSRVTPFLVDLAAARTWLFVKVETDGGLARLGRGLHAGRP